MTLKEKQKALDSKKWVLSEQTGKDLCGTFEYCVACIKNNKYPCASAYFKFHRKKDRSNIK